MTTAGRGRSPGQWRQPKPRGLAMRTRPLVDEVQGSGKRAAQITCGLFEIIGLLTTEPSKEYDQP